MEQPFLVAKDVARIVRQRNNYVLVAEDAGQVNQQDNDVMAAEDVTVFWLQRMSEE